MSEQLIRYSYGPKAKVPSRALDWKTKIVSTPVHGFYELEPSVPVEGAGTLAYLLGEPCDGYVHDVYQPLEAPGDGSLLGQTLTYAGAVALAKAWHAEVKAAAAAEKAEADAIEADTVLDDPEGPLAMIHKLLDTPVDEVQSVAIDTAGTVDATPDGTPDAT